MQLTQIVTADKMSLGVLSLKDPQVTDLLVGMRLSLQITVACEIRAKVVV